MKSGKEFESQLKASIPKDVYFLRLNDPAQSYFQSDKLQFSPQNPYDCFFYKYPNLFTIELKSTEGTAITFYREDFVEKDKKQSFMIRKNQIEGLLKSVSFEGIISGFILNFRKNNETYFLSINDFTHMISNINKKSFNIEDICNAGGYCIPQKLKKIKYTYDIDSFIQRYKTKGEQ